VKHIVPIFCVFIALLLAIGSVNISVFANVDGQYYYEHDYLAYEEHGEVRTEYDVLPQESIIGIIPFNSVEVGTFDEFRDALRENSPGSITTTIVLTDNITMPYAPTELIGVNGGPTDWRIRQDRHITITSQEGSRHTIYMAAPNDNNAPALRVFNGGTLTLDNVILQHQSGNNARAGIIASGGGRNTVSLVNAAISGFTNAAIYTFGEGAALGTEINVDADSIIEHNSRANNGGGIHVGLRSTLYLHGTVRHNHVRDSGGQGGGIATATAPASAVNATINILPGALVHNNDAGAQGNGGGIRLAAASTLNMSGGEIHTNNAGSSANGGGVRLDNSTFFMTGGQIRNNNAANGGGVYAAAGSAVTLSGTLVENEMYEAEIFSNNAVNHGFDGAAPISGQGGGVRLTNSNLTINAGAVIRNNNAMSGAGISTSPGASTAIVTLNAGGQVINNDSEAQGAGARFMGDTTFHMHGGSMSGNSAGTAGGAIHMGGTTIVNMNNDIVEMTGNDALEGGAVFVVNETTFNMRAGATIHENNARGGGAIFVAGGGTLDIQDGIIRGNTADAYDVTSEQLEVGVAIGGGGIFVANGGNMNISGDSRISNNRALFSPGGGIRLISAADANIGPDVVINNNIAGQTGGGLHVGGNTAFYMDGSRVYENRAYGVDGGGGVMVGPDASLIMQSGSVIRDNVAVAGGGGGIHMSGTLTMHGGEIYDNNAAGNGGGVLFILVDDAAARSGTFDMLGGTIRDNTATSGGGVHVTTSRGHTANFNISGSSSITGNTARSLGGGVNLNAGGISAEGGMTAGTTILTMEDDAVIGGNSAAQSGGGIHLFNNELGSASITISTNPSGGIIGNIADTTGGGIHLAGRGTSALTMHNGIISNNHAGSAHSGGGVMVWGEGDFRMYGGTISGNTAGRVGGGVALAGSEGHNSRFHMQGNSVITANTAQIGGGIGITSVSGNNDIRDALIQRLTIIGDGTSVMGNIAPSQEPNTWLREETILQIDPQFAEDAGAILRVNPFNNRDIMSEALMELQVRNHFLANDGLSGQGFFPGHALAGVYRADETIYNNAYDGSHRLWSFDGWRFYDAVYEDSGRRRVFPTTHPPQTGPDNDDRMRLGLTIPNTFEVIAEATWRVYAPRLLPNSISCNQFSIISIPAPHQFFTEYRLLDVDENDLPYQYWTTSTSFTGLDSDTQYMVVVRFVPIGYPYNTNTHTIVGPTPDEYLLVRTNAIITFDINGGDTLEPSDQCHPRGGRVTYPHPLYAVPARDGYEFGGWRGQNGVIWNFADDPVLGNMTLIAYWYPLHTIIFTSANIEQGTIAGGTPNVTRFLLGGEYVGAPPEISPVEGWTFSHWTSSRGGYFNNIELAEYEVVGDTTFTAHFSESAIYRRITGYVWYDGWNVFNQVPATVRLYNASDSALVAQTTALVFANNGRFEFAYVDSAGTYYMIIHKQNHTGVIVQNITFDRTAFLVGGSANPALISNIDYAFTSRFILFAGNMDAIYDDEINTLDWSLLINSMFQTHAQALAQDLNDDEEINVLDQSLLLNNFLQTGRNVQHSALALAP